MAVVILNAETLPAYVAALDRLTPVTFRQWGSLTPHQVLRHLRQTIDISLGEVDDPGMKDMSMPVLRDVIYGLFFVTFTKWPGSKFKAPDFFLPDPEADFDGEREALYAAMRRFVAEAEADPGRRILTPLLGRITMKRWRRVHGVHLRHHLRQFGLMD